MSSIPAEFICEGIDQTRGWFYSLHAISTFLFGKPAYRNVIVNELILDKDGQKMSKSKGNTVNPFDTLSRYGADTTRWYLVTNSPPWRPTMFDEDGLAEVQRKFFGTLVNTYAFFALYANIDRFTYAEPRIPVAERPEIDRWILSALQSLVQGYRASMESYDVTQAARSRQRLHDRQAVELVRPAEPPAFLEERDGEGQDRGVPDAVRVPRDGGEADRTVRPVHRRGTLQEPERPSRAWRPAESVHLSSMPRAGPRGRWMPNSKSGWSVPNGS